MPAFARSFPILVLLGALPWLTAACDKERPAEPGAEVAENRTAPVLPVAVPEPSIADREALLIAAFRAASAAAGGEDDREAQARLDGARFELAIRFGCAAATPAPAPVDGGTATAGGPGAAAVPGKSAASPPAPSAADAPATGAMGWSFDAEAQRLRVHASPGISREDPVVASVAGSAIEAAEGFWIPRPWLLSAVCPSGAMVPTATAATAPRLGIVQFFTPADSRTERRERRPYESVQTLPPGEVAGLRTGFDLVLSGRLKAFNGRVVNCVARGPDAPPACLISVEFGNVRLVRPDTRAVLAQWGQG